MPSRPPYSAASSARRLGKESSTSSTAWAASGPRASSEAAWNQTILPRPVEEVTLTLANLTGESATQMGLLRDVRKEKTDRLVEAERQLQARMQGKRVLFRVVDIAPWHPAPELRALQVPIDPAVKDSMKPLATPTAAGSAGRRG